MNHKAGDILCCEVCGTIYECMNTNIYEDDYNYVYDIVAARTVGVICEHGSENIVKVGEL